VILEIYRLNEYTRSDFNMSYLRTKGGAEIDLILDRPGSPDILIEIKSTFFAQEADGKHLKELSQDWKNSCVSYIFSQDKRNKKFGEIECLHWMDGIKKIFGLNQNNTRDDS
jgi:predicted AAA+ superfamily ATPase